MLLKGDEGGLGGSIDWALAAINGTAKLERAEMRAADERRAGTQFRGQAAPHRNGARAAGP